ncbi:hypothetical protein DPSP01_011900 [Paraphaeosphaeria sporulosa]
MINVDAWKERAAITHAEGSCGCTPDGLFQMHYACLLMAIADAHERLYTSNSAARQPKDLGRKSDEGPPH